MNKLKWVPVPERQGQGEEKWIPVRKTQTKFYKDVPLYNKTSDGKYIAYKPAGATLDDRQIARAPKVLYINQKDKIRAIREVQRGFNRHLKTEIISGDLVKVKAILVNIVEETLAEPRSGSLEEIPKTVDILVAEYAKQPDVVKNLASLSSFDYTTVIHSINVMALTLGFCFYAGYALEDVKICGLSALLHDLGKIAVPIETLTAPRKLTNEEFQQIKAHPHVGHQILKDSGFDETISFVALEHHEKLDGSGYPQGIVDISQEGILIGIIDCYEALTNDDRPYRSAMDPFKALELIKKEVRAGKYSRAIFEKFVYSLA